MSDEVESSNFKFVLSPVRMTRSLFFRYFISAQALAEHLRSKVHKRRLKQLEDEPYSIEESLRAAGIGSYVEPKKRIVQSQPTEEGQEYTPPVEVM